MCASATGYYGSRGAEELDESSPRGDGFLAEVVEQWEAAAEPARTAGLRVVHLRQGLILAKHGGALQRMLLPFRLGFGGNVGERQAVVELGLPRRCGCRVPLRPRAAARGAGQRHRAADGNERRLHQGARTGAPPADDRAGARLRDQARVRGDGEDDAPRGTTRRSGEASPIGLCLRLSRSRLRSRAGALAFRLTAGCGSIWHQR